MIFSSDNTGVIILGYREGAKSLIHLVQGLEETGYNWETGFGSASFLLFLPHTLSSGRTC